MLYSILDSHISRKELYKPNLHAERNLWTIWQQPGRISVGPGRNKRGREDNSVTSNIRSSKNMWDKIYRCRKKVFTSFSRNRTLNLKGLKLLRFAINVCETLYTSTVSPTSGPRALKLKLADKVGDFTQRSGLHSKV